MWYNMGVLCLGREYKILFDRGTGSGQPNLSPEIILGTEIPMPDFKPQKKTFH